MKPVRSFLICLPLALALIGCNSATTSHRTSSPKRFDTSIDIALYKKAVRENPKNPKYLIDLGEKYTATSQWTLAAASFREALLVHPGNQRAQVGFSYALAGMGNYHDSYRHIVPMLGKNGRDEKVTLIAGIALDGVGKKKASHQIYHRILRSNPRSLSARNNLALSMAFAGDERSYELMRQVALSPDSQLRHKRNLILVSALLGDHHTAHQDAAAMRIPPDITKRILDVAAEARSDGMAVVGIANAQDL